MNPRDQLLAELTAERFAPIPTCAHPTNYHGPSSEYAYLVRQRLLWELAGEDDPETAAVRVDTRASRPSPRKDPHDPLLPVARDTCADGGDQPTENDDTTRRTA